MFYNVVVKDSDYFENEFFNQLVFSFDELNEALEFANLILKISNYRIEIIPIEEKEE